MPSKRILRSEGFGVSQGLLRREPVLPDQLIERLIEGLHPEEVAPLLDHKIS